MGNHELHVLKKFGLPLLLSFVLTMVPFALASDYDDELLTDYYADHLRDTTSVAPPTEAQMHVEPSAAKLDPVSSEKNQGKQVSEGSSADPNLVPEGTAPSPVGTDPGAAIAEQNQELGQIHEGSTVGPDVQLGLLAAQNTNAVRKMADIMSTIVSKLSTRDCTDTSGSSQNLQILSNSIKEGFTVLVKVIQELNTTVQHFQEDISRKSFSFQGVVSRVFGDSGTCPAPFFLVGEDCLFIETEHLRDFNSARQACIEMGAKLAELNIYEPFIAAVGAMNLHEDAAIYVGATDADSEGDWKWLSGTSMDNVPWGEDEPNNSYDHEHCASYSVEMESFNDLNCNSRIEYACMRK